ncbi:class I SAM-dependent methyltransferase [Tianweitania sp. BSSL-BM11]|uniref:Class I SAM-dependent methyltransferase n=1 Tax=Tianweitania aestuarii TaxID=2814886 RepID=A0ABS5RQB3_9HYPH|nr:class I SAM-dependent methyltransferase [Tianweitania aestuarii]MBS9719228.1 class I SAM-dependent methyltransferase [Tianweitania aestuarii]
MTDDALRTLFHPFEAGLVDLPEPGTRALFPGARPGWRKPEGFEATITAVQGFRPDFLGLKRQGISTVPQGEGEGYDLALVLGSKHRGQNEGWIAEAQRRVKPGGLIVVAASKKDGGDSLRKRIAELTEVEDHAAKHHGVVFWLRNGGTQLKEAAAETVGSFQTRPGMFSHGHADPGSMFLLESLPADLKGDVADFCAGWGYLAADLIGRERIRSVDLYEADHASLEAARTAMGAAEKPMGFFWHDLTSEPVERVYDAVVMNPPFHAGGHAAEPDLGAKLIRAAASALKGHGRLFIVANRGLPYERALTAVFAETGELARNDDYKILWASEPQTRNMARAATQLKARGRPGAPARRNGAGRRK